MKAAGIIGGVASIIRKGAWQLALEDKPAPKNGKSGMKKRTNIPKSTMLSMAHDKAGGMTSAAIAQKYALSKCYVENSLQKLYINSKVGREILKGVLLEGAIATGMRAHDKIGDLTGMQSVLATSALTSRFIELDKHTINQPAEVDWAELAEATRDLAELRKELGVDEDNDKEPGIIDI